MGLSVLQGSLGIILHLILQAWSYPFPATGELSPIHYSSKVGVLGAVYFASVRELGVAYTSGVREAWAQGMSSPPEVAGAPFFQQKMLESCSPPD